jgi:hypothetical protein
VTKLASLLRVAENIVRGGGDSHDRQALDAAHAADLAQALRHLAPADRVAFFRLLGRARAGEVLAELDDDTLLELVRDLDEAEVSRILDRMPPEHVADVVEELPTEQAEKILDLMEAGKSEEVQELLEYQEDSAGRLMSPDVVAVHESATVEDAIQHIRKSIADERAFELYVVDDHQHLVGVMPLRRLLIADPKSRILGLQDDRWSASPPRWTARRSRASSPSTISSPCPSWTANDDSSAPSPSTTSSTSSARRPPRTSSASPARTRPSWNHAPRVRWRSCACPGSSRRSSSRWSRASSSTTSTGRWGG